jgi:hypothetical protein
MTSFFQYDVFTFDEDGDRHYVETLVLIHRHRRKRIFKSLRLRFPLHHRRIRFTVLSDTEFEWLVEAGYMVPVPRKRRVPYREVGGLKEQLIECGFWDWNAPADL